MAQSAFLNGMKAAIPIMVGVAPFGMISGVAAVGAGLSAGESFGMSIIVFAGASQLVALQLITVNSPLFIIWLSTFMINLRFMMYSGSLAPHVANLSRPWKFLIAYLLTDQAYAISLMAYGQGVTGGAKKWYYLGTAVSLWTVWQSTTLIGILLGAQIPPQWSLDFAIPLTFLALVFPALADRASWAAAVVAGITAVFAANLPYNSGLIVAALIGILIGLLVEKYDTRNPVARRES